MDIPSECKSVSKNPKIVVKDKTSKSQVHMVFVNKSALSVDVIEVDGCAIKDGIKCDYLLKLNDTEYYVELKGGDVPHAVEQLERTITLLSNDIQKQKKYCFVISSRSPLASPEIQEIQIRFKKRYNSKFIVKNTYLEYPIP